MTVELTDEVYEAYCAVAQAAEALEDSFRVGGVVWLSHQDKLRDALAALHARLEEQ